MQSGMKGAEYITPFGICCGAGYILLNATTARIFAKIVGVFKTSEGVLIVGVKSF